MPGRWVRKGRLMSLEGAGGAGIVSTPKPLLLVDCAEDYEQLVEDIVRDGRLYASENHQEILKASECAQEEQPAFNDHINNVQAVC